MYHIDQNSSWIHKIWIWKLMNAKKVLNLCFPFSFDKTVQIKECVMKCTHFNLMASKNGQIN